MKADADGSIVSIVIDDAILVQLFRLLGIAVMSGFTDDVSSLVSMIPNHLFPMIGIELLLLSSSFSSEAITVLVLFLRFCFLVVLVDFFLLDVDCFSFPPIRLDWSFSLDFDVDDSFFVGVFGVVILSVDEALFFFLLLLSFIGDLGLFVYDFFDSFDFISDGAISIPLTSTADAFFGVLGRSVLVLRRLVFVAFIFSSASSSAAPPPAAGLSLTKNCASSSLE